MTKGITDSNEFQPLAALRKAADHPAVAEIEGGGCDPGRVLVHLKDGWTVKGYDARSFGVGVALESDGASMTRAGILRENRKQLAYKLSLIVRLAEVAA